jgi:hypothetical protein
MLVDTGGNGLQLERQSTLAQQTDSAEAALIGAGDLGEGFVGFFGAAVEGDFDGEGRPLQQVVGDFFGN